MLSTKDAVRELPHAGEPDQRLVGNTTDVLHTARCCLVLNVPGQVVNRRDCDSSF